MVSFAQLLAEGIDNFNDAYCNTKLSPYEYRFEYGVIKC